MIINAPRKRVPDVGTRRYKRKFYFFKRFKDKICICGFLYLKQKLGAYDVYRYEDAQQSALDGVSYCKKDLRIKPKWLHNALYEFSSTTCRCGAYWETEMIMTKQEAFQDAL